MKKCFPQFAFKSCFQWSKPNEVAHHKGFQIVVSFVWEPVRDLYCGRTCFFFTFDQQLNDNSEALVHQRLATKMLAAKMREMEKDHSEQSLRKSN